MYAFIEGIIDELGEDTATVNACGVGYCLLCSKNTLNLLQTGQKARLYAQLNISQDAVSLYGFCTKEEKAMFMRLTSVSRVGPKAALSMLSAMRTDELAAAIASSDADALARAPGLGKKTAQRIILELKEKIAAEASPVVGMAAGANASERQEAVTALMALGYSQSEASTAAAAATGDTVSELIKSALINLARV